MEKQDQAFKPGSGYNTYIRTVACHYLRKIDQKALIDWHSSGFRLFDQYEHLVEKMKRDNPRAFLLTPESLHERQFFHCPTSLDVPYRRCYRK